MIEDGGTFWHRFWTAGSGRAATPHDMVGPPREFEATIADAFITMTVVVCLASDVKRALKERDDEIARLRELVA